MICRENNAEMATDSERLKTTNRLNIGIPCSEIKEVLLKRVFINNQNGRTKGIEAD